jgi:hypothetical protein
MKLLYMLSYTLNIMLIARKQKRLKARDYNSALLFNSSTSKLD